MRIYVAAKWEEKDQARRLMTLLEQHGHTITYDWTQCSVCDAEQAQKDRQGVMSADAFVGLFERDLAYCGAIAEFGMACAREIPCYLIGHAIDVERGKCIFTKLPNVHQGETFEDAITYLSTLV